MTLAQPALPFRHRPRYDPADFIAGAPNEAALAWLADPARWPGLRLALHGPPGAGKTHLLHLFAYRNSAALAPAAALPADPAAPLAIDDADQAPEAALLHLLNLAAERRLPLLLAARAAPARWPLALPDLASRLAATTAVAIAEPDDALLAALLARLLAERQLAVAPHVQTYLLNRLPRTAAAMRDAAATLDRAGLEARRPVTRALAAATLGFGAEA